MNQSIDAYFCLDIGGSGTRGALFNESGERLAYAEAEAGALSLGVQQAIFSVWDKISTSLQPGIWRKENVSLIAGIAGYSLPGRTALLTQVLDEFCQVEIVSDGYGALLGATQGKPGALISIGTGVGALRLGKNGQTHTISGWGFPAGDAGSGAWLGLRAFGDFLKHLDGIILPPALPHKLTDSFLGHVSMEPQGK